MAEPEPPLNVRAVRGGQVLPLEVVYDGFRDGMHWWITVATISITKDTVVMLDTLPAHTSVQVRTVESDDEAWSVWYQEGGG